MKTKLIFHSFLKARSLKLEASCGFALVELLVAVALFGIISSFVIIAYSRISGQLSLTTLAYEVALSFREAQSYGVSVHEFTGGQTDTFDVGYGLHFDAGNLNTYVMFADAGGVEGDGRFNGQYGGEYNDTGCLDPDECMSVFRMEKGNKLYKFCGVLAGDQGRDVPDAFKQEECSVEPSPPGGPNGTISFIDVTFLRPNPDALIATSEVGQQYKAARVYIISPTGDKRVIEVVNTGQISIK